MKVLILASLFYARHQGGSDSVDDFLEFAKKFGAKQGGGFAFKTALGSSFLNASIRTLDLASNEMVVKTIMEELYIYTRSAEPKDMFNTKIDGFMQDLWLKKLRAFLVKTISSKKSQGELRELCVRLLLRIGLISGNPEDLLLATKYQFEFKIDISDELEYLCKQSEVFKNVTSEENITADYYLEHSGSATYHIYFKEG